MPVSPHGTRRISFACLAAAILSCVALGGPAGAQQQVELPSSDEPVLHEITPEARRAIEDGVEWLARQQRDRIGDWPSAEPRYRMSVTALAGLALLAHGETPETGPYAKHLRACLVWILDMQDRQAGGRYDGLLYDGEDPTGQEERPMHGHGFALLLLASASGQTREPALRERMQRGIRAGIRLTERAISRDGGWYYYPVPVSGSSMQDEGSVTITQMQALRSARNAGFAVDANVVRRAAEYVRDSQLPSGGVRYTKNWGDASAALTAAGIAVLHGAGEYHSDVIEKGYGYLRQHLTTSRDQKFFFYTQLYASQAMFQRGGPEWAAYLPRIRRELLEMRKGYPYWDQPGLGKTYATAIALLILQLPLRYLPIHQR